MLAMAVTASCTIDDRGWDSLGTDGFEYLDFPDEVMENVVEDAVTLLDYMVRVDSLVENPVAGQLYRVPDSNGDYVCVLKCEVSGSDTVWVLNNSRYMVSREDGTWQVRYGETSSYLNATDEYLSYYYFRYDYVLSAVMGTVTDKGICRYPWEVTLTGTREENSDYSMSFSIDSPMKISWQNPKQYDSGKMLPTGELDIKFLKGDKELDYLHAIYNSGVMSYYTSLPAINGMLY